MGKRAVLTWDEFEKRITMWEASNPGQRITRIYFDGRDAPVHFVGIHSECDLSHGEPSLRLSSGETISI